MLARRFSSGLSSINMSAGNWCMQKTPKTAEVGRGTWDWSKCIRCPGGNVLQRHRTHCLSFRDHNSLNIQGLPGEHQNNTSSVMRGVLSGMSTVLFLGFWTSLLDGWRCDQQFGDAPIGLVGLGLGTSGDSGQADCSAGCWPQMKWSRSHFCRCKMGYTQKLGQD